MSTRAACGLACVCVFVLLAGADAPVSTAPATQPEGLLIEGIVVNHMGGGVVDAAIEITAPDSPTPLVTGRTNETGDIALHLPAGRKLPVRIRVSKDGYTEFTQAIEQTEDDEPPYVDVTLEGAGRVEGTVVARAGGKPIRGATVACENGGRRVETTTDEEGRYTIAGTEQGAARMEVIADGWATERKAMVLKSDVTQCNLQISPEWPVEFIVVTSEGDPAIDVMLEAIVEPAQAYVVAQTDDAGIARLRGIGPDARRLQIRLSGERYVHAPDYMAPIDLATTTAPADTPPPPFRGRLVAQLAAVLKGKVVNASGQAVVGVRVIAGREVRADMPMIWTALDGTYELTGVPPGSNVISWQHDDYVTAIREVQLSVGQTSTQEITLETGTPLAGVVVNEEGKPLEQVWVTVESWKGYRTLGMRAITGPDGVFKFPHAPEGELEFSFFCSGFSPLTEQKLASGRTDHRITLKGRAAPQELPELTDKVKPGEAVPDFHLTASDGTTYKLSALRGKYVFLDCWASWCGPCMAEVPHVKALYESMRKRPDFVMIGVSLDTDEDACRKAIESTGMAWPQAFGPDSGASDTFESLDGFAIPYTCLIGPDGRLIAQRLSGPTLLETVSKHLQTSATKQGQ